MTKFAIFQKLLIRERNRDFYKRNGEKSLEEVLDQDFINFLRIGKPNAIILNDVKDVYKLTLKIAKSKRRDIKVKNFLKRLKLKEYRELLRDKI